MPQSEDSPKRQSQVAGQINTLERELPQLHEGIDSLPKRLASVLRQPSPGSAKAESKDSEELVVLACTIQGFVDSVRSAREKIDNLLSRLEL